MLQWLIIDPTMTMGLHLIPNCVAACAAVVHNWPHYDNRVKFYLTKCVAAHAAVVNNWPHYDNRVKFYLKKCVAAHAAVVNNWPHYDNRPYALTSRLHNNDAMLGVKTCRAACTCCAGRALALSASQSVRGPGPAGRYGICRRWPAGCMLGDGARDSASFDPQHAGAPFCDVICIRSMGIKLSLIV